MSPKVVSAMILVCLLVASVYGLPTPTQKANPGEYGEYFEGDMILSPNTEMNTRAGRVGDQYRWPQAVVPYTIDVRFDKQDRLLIEGALAHLEKHTCIRFVVRTDERNYVRVFYGPPGSGYFSSVGKVGLGQKLNLQPDLVGRQGTIVHEFIHALGFFHEQSRTDRDDYVTINWDNIRDGAENNFEKYGADRVDPHGVTYDYGSIMHYGAYGFAINPFKPTIVAPRGVVIGQREALSEKDIEKLNNMYCDVE